MRKMTQNLIQIKLSPYAKMFYVEWLINPISTRYNMIFMDELTGDIDIARLEQSIHRYIRDHWLLHSHIENKEGELYWIQNNNITGLEYYEGKATNEELLTYINHPFDLQKDQLCRFKLWRVGIGQYQFITVMHHIITDALSVREGVFEGLSHYYNDKNHAQAYTIEQQKKKLANLSDFYYDRLLVEKSKHHAFWAQQLKDIEYIDLSFLKREDKPPQKILLDKYNLTKKIQFNFDTSVIQRLTQLKRKYLITPYYFGLCVFAILLHRYTGQRKFVIPYPVAIKKGIHHIFGAQVNTTLMPYEFEADSTFLGIFNKNRAFLKSTKNESFHFTEFPNIELFNESNKQLLNVVFNQANFRLQTYRFDGVTQNSILDNFNMYLKDMLLFEQEEKEQTLHYQVRFDITQMDEFLVQQFANNFKRLFVEILDDLENNITNKPLHAYSLLNPSMYQQIVQELNNTQQALYTQKTIHELFVEQVRKTPGNIAVIFKDVQLSYLELNQRADELAVVIHNTYRLNAEELIVLHLDRSHHMVIAILAVLKTGCAYIPVSPELPENGLLHVLADSKSKLILANETHQIKLTHCLKRLSLESTHCPKLMTIDSSGLTKQEHRPTFNRADSKSLAYVLYTSGSTGRPKGVMMEHLACVNKVIEMIRFSQITSRDIILFKTNYIFDVSFTDIFCGLLTGSRLIITKDTFNISEITQHLNGSGISICHFTPSQFDVIKNIKGPQLFENLRVIHFSGEALHPQLLDDIDEAISCINYYGPTEAGEVSAELKRRTSTDYITIGYPLGNIQFYIVDKNLNPLPFGVVGELCIGGIALARGYLNQTDLTQEKFIQNPFHSPDEENRYRNDRLYRTGDLVRRLSSGNIEYIGRNDSQIKIRGYRVELGEIENQIKTFPGIRHAVVLDRVKNQSKNAPQVQEKYLIAFYFSDVEISPSVMRDYLMQRLPDYMLPDVFQHLNKLPLTVNGKLDIKGLPLAEPAKNRRICVLPKNPLEEKICLSYAEILNIPMNEISVQDDFFQLGGNSILAIRLLFKLEKNLDIRIADIFKLRTPEKIAENVSSTKNDLKQKIENIVQFYRKYNYGTRDLQAENTCGSIASKNAYYLETIKKIKIEKEDVNKIENVLLTGSTGHLGCNILGKLLTETPYKIYLLIRADSHEIAVKRVTQKFSFYFDKDLNLYKDRVVILNAEIQQPNFKLSDAQYNLLISQIDSVIHCAGLVKHYGEYDEFYQANVQTTINLLDFSQLMRGKSFNYISTIGVLINGYIPGKSYYLADEEDCMENFKLGKNFYIQTKHKSEQLVSKYRSFGVNGSIFRVGNLGMHSVNYRVQENIEENLFFAHLKTMLYLGMIPDEMSEMEISPVDCTAKAVVKLFDKASLNNQTHHIFNPRVCNLMQVLKEFRLPQIRRCTLVEFINAVLVNIYADTAHDKSHLFALYQLWLQEGDEIHSTKMRLANEKTEAILGKLDFYWPTITSDMIVDFVKHAISSAAIQKETT